jgi:hypothetical protein
MLTARYPLRRLSVVALLLVVNACGGSDSSSRNSVSFGGAACETGATFGDISRTGYDTLYNFESQSNVPVALNLDTRNNAKECGDVLTAQAVFPWVRIDTQPPHDDPSKLSMQLVEEGGRNSPVLATFAVADFNAQSAQGEFSYSLSFKTYNADYSVASEVDCDVKYQGSYCPRFAKRSSSAATQFDFSADGSISCAVNYADGSAAGRCDGTLSATNALLNAGFYGE